MAEGLTLSDAARRAWDVVIAGAGPAGSVAAQALARAGRAVLLVDRCAFPRRKTCGCCLSDAAVQLLRREGMSGALAGGVPLSEFRLHAGGRQASLPLPGGVALSRETFDAALIRHAQAAGAAFLPQTEVSVERAGASGRPVWLAQPGARVRTAARVVLAADGLGGALAQSEPACRIRLDRRPRIGVSASLPSAPPWCEAGTILMACGSEGYAGLVRLEDGRLNIAAALAPGAVAAHRGAGRAVAALVRRAGLPSLPVETLAWQGVPALGRRRTRVAAERLLLLGDAAGYVEPFTGEGMTWAMASGLAVAPLVLAARACWEPGLAAAWDGRYRRLLGARQHRCRLVTQALRYPALTGAAVRLLSWFPGIATPVTRVLHTWGSSCPS